MKLVYGKEVAQGPLADGNFDGGPNYVPKTSRAQRAKSIVSPNKDKAPSSPFYQHQILGSNYPIPIQPSAKPGNGVPVNSDTQQVRKRRGGRLTARQIFEVLISRGDLYLPRLVSAIPKRYSLRSCRS